MNVPGDIYVYLQTISAVTDLVNTRVYHGIAPQEAALPYVVMDEEANEGAHHFGGAVGINDLTVSFNIWAASQASANAVHEALRGALDGLIGSSIGSGPTSVRGAERLERQTVAQPKHPGDESPLFFGRSVYLITHTQSVPTP